MNILQKISLTVLSAVIVSVSCASADTSNCAPECPQALKSDKCSRFLCTDSEIEDVFNRTGLSAQQVCSASKLQEKYAQETLSINERINYEENILNEMKSSCSKNSEIREQKKKINNLEKKRKQICRCYENQFKTMLSPQQWKKYKKI